jgi:hypothetical protein
VVGGLVSHFKLGLNRGDEGNAFQNNLRTAALTGQMGAMLHLNVGPGKLMVGPVFRMALTDHGKKTDPEFLTEESGLKPYSTGVQVGYFWRL